MSRFLVDLGMRLVGNFVRAVLGLAQTLLTLMALSAVSLFVGVDRAVDRLETTMAEQFTGIGVSFNYIPVTRNSLRVAAVLMLVVGWLLDLGVIWLLISLIV